MSWCDKLASTPTVGLTFSPQTLSGASLLSALAPLLDEWTEGDKQKFTLSKQDAFSAEVTTDDGFKYGVDSTRLSVEFHHRLKVKQVSGGPPVVEMLSRPAPFTELLPDVCERALRLSALVSDPGPRTLRRLGIVSTTIVAEDEAPPGILRFIRYVARPWDNFLDHYAFSMTAPISNASGWSDRCIHQILKPDDPEALVTIIFDWQRTFATPKRLTPASLRSLLTAARTDATEYFEDLAEGNRFDVDLLSQKT